MKSYKLNEIDGIKIIGRTILNNKGLSLFWNGSGIEINAKAKSLFIDIECEYDNVELMLDVILEGERTQKLVLEKGLKKYMVFNGMYGEQAVNVRIIRDTQCMPDEKKHRLIIKSMETDGVFEAVPDLNRKIEFIGDSLTSGEGCGLTRRVEWIPVVFDAVENYTYKTARLLNADYQVLSQSGWGLYASWDANLKNVLPDYYEQICGTTNDEACISMGAHDKWDFSLSKTDAVIINLGTNDSGALKTGKFDKEEFILAFKKKGIEFLKTVRKHNGSSFIVWAYGMLGDDMEPYINELINEYGNETGDEKIGFLKLPDCKGEDLGVRFHPTPKAHEKVAICLAGYLESVLNK